MSPSESKRSTFLCRVLSELNQQLTFSFEPCHNATETRQDLSRGGSQEPKRQGLGWDKEEWLPKAGDSLRGLRLGLDQRHV